MVAKGRVRVCSTLNWTSDAFDLVRYLHLIYPAAFQIGAILGLPTAVRVSDSQKTVAILVETFDISCVFTRLDCAFSHTFQGWENHDCSTDTVLHKIKKRRQFPPFLIIARGARLKTN